MIDDVVGAYVTGATSDGYAEDWDLEQLWTSLKQLYPVGITIEDLEEEAGGRTGSTPTSCTTSSSRTPTPRTTAARRSSAPRPCASSSAWCCSQVIDRKWREHLYEMDYLQEGISLRAYAQRDPVVEYQREGFDMFSQMLEGIKEEAVGFLFNLEVQVEEAAPQPDVDLGRPTGAAARAEAAVESTPRASAATGAAARCSTPRRRSTARPVPAASSSRSEAPALGLGGTGAPAPGRRPAVPGRRRRSGPARRPPPASRPRARRSASAARPATPRARAAPARSTSAATAPPTARDRHAPRRPAPRAHRGAWACRSARAASGARPAIGVEPDWRWVEARCAAPATVQRAHRGSIGRVVRARR